MTTTTNTRSEQTMLAALRRAPQADGIKLTVANFRHRRVGLQDQVKVIQLRHELRAVEIR
jgi:hypothetical protein